MKLLQHYQMFYLKWECNFSILMNLQSNVQEMLILLYILNI